MNNNQNILSVRLTDEETAKLKLLSKQTALRESVVIRRLIMAAKTEPAQAWTIQTDSVEQALYRPN